MQPQPIKDPAVALTLEINRCHRIFTERKQDIERASDEGLALYGELGLTILENELRKAGTALLCADEQAIKESLNALQMIQGGAK